MEERRRIEYQVKFGAALRPLPCEVDETFTQTIENKGVTFKVHRAEKNHRTGYCEVLALEVLSAAKKDEKQPNETSAYCLLLGLFSVVAFLVIKWVVEGLTDKPDEKH